MPTTLFPELPSLCARARRAGALLLLTGLVLAAGAMRAEPTADAGDPGTIVDTLHDKLVEAMKNSAELGYEGRYRELEPIVLASFDTPLIVKVILSRYWTELNEQQRNDFISTFNRLSTATYASRFKDYDDEQFVEMSREQLKNNRLMIRTEMQRPGKKPVRLDYLMQQAEDGRWWIISVIANGVSDLSLKRAEYAVVIKERGFDSLVQDIGEKIRQLEVEARDEGKSEEPP
ncbi:MAG: ABC transporter substrate-binding protein [Gammaproteobacteria bacterium]|nr:ABC transporter substrate-binding protein [Gammaproteobacteria bacterium]